MNIFKIVSGLQSYSEGVVTFAFDSTFASAVTAAAQLLIKQGERIVEMEEAAGVINTENIRLASENARLQLELEAARGELDAATKRMAELKAQFAQPQQAENISKLSEDDTRQKLYDLLEDHCILHEYGECNNPKAPDCIWCLADALVKRGVTVEGEYECRAIIVKQPTVDAVEVVHGRWIEHSHLEIGGECSVCGWQFQWFENDEANYCPHCGAKMDGNGDD